MPILENVASWVMFFFFKTMGYLHTRKNSCISNTMNFTNNFTRTEWNFTRKLNFYRRKTQFFPRQNSIKRPKFNFWIHFSKSRVKNLPKKSLLLPFFSLFFCLKKVIKLADYGSPNKAESCTPS